MVCNLPSLICISVKFLKENVLPSDKLLKTVLIYFGFYLFTYFFGHMQHKLSYINQSINIIINYYYNFIFGAVLQMNKPKGKFKSFFFNQCLYLQLQLLIRTTFFFSRLCPYLMEEMAS